MTTYSFYGVVGSVLSAGSYTGDTPKILQGSLESKSHAVNYGISLEEGDTPEITSDHQGTILCRTISGIIHAWAQKQATLDTLEQDVLDVLKAASLSYDVKNITHEAKTSKYSVSMEVEVIA